MKKVVRRGVFETNSSSTHVLALVSKKEYEADKAKEKPKYRNYGEIFTKRDKLYMACGCCEELYSTEETINRFASSGDKTDVERKKQFDAVKAFIGQGAGDYADIFHDENLYYEVAIGLITSVYCELTGEDYDKVYAEVMNINDSGRACHMKFFSEHALDEAEWDYKLIDDMFEGGESEIREALRKYFDDDAVLMYRECYGSLGIWDDDDED